MDRRRVQNDLDILREFCARGVGLLQRFVMKRALLLAGIAVAAAGCFGGPKEIPPLDAKFVTNDCDLIGAVARDHYKLTRNDPQMRAMMIGEDLPWRPGCGFQAMGFNLTEVSGPEGAAATQGMAEVAFHRPKYDSRGAEIRSEITRGPEPAVRVLCRLAREDNAWSVETCGPDPKTTQPRPPPPSPADATPDSARTPLPTDRPPVARDATIPTPDPGAPRN
jgi:hypothetical protein